MPCYHPLRAFPVGLTENGKKKMRITGYNINHLEIYPREIKFCESEKYSPYASEIITKDKSIVVPCGQCVGCRLDYSREWANRCMLELEQHQHAYFLTLTYNEEHVPISCYEDEDGNCLPALSLCKRDFQLFMKRWRKYFESDASDNIPTRYFASLEYGSDSFRPHYHAIVFGPEIPDLEVFSRTPLGHVYFRSAIVDRLWSMKNPHYRHERCTTPLSIGKFGGRSASFALKAALSPP